ncbi:MAG: ATP-binding cassette domain-containing protein [Spirochaetes bacterium]|nr:ATP-binding cassette domain-containing protein [Spirochaetota bacterium]
MEYAIRTEKLSRFFGKQKAVDQIDLTIHNGQVYGFLGRNGAGKTTTIRMLLGLLHKSEGKIYFHGQELEKNKKNILAKVGAMIEFPGFYSNLTAKENLKIYHSLLGIQKKHAIEEVMDIVSLNFEDKKLVSKFSLGMKQRLGFARALLHDPEILILDEPTNGLDPAGIKEIRILIKKLAEVHDKTLFVSSHLLSEVEQIAHKIGIIHEGKLLEEISLAEINKRTRRCIFCLVDNPEKTAFVLEQKLAISDYEIYPEGEVHIYQNLDQIAMINRTLVTAGVEVSSIKLSKDNLEDYFLKLTDTNKDNLTNDEIMAYSKPMLLI